MKDVIVVVPGIMGSSLYRDGKPVWDTKLEAITGALLSRFRSARDLRLPEGIADHPAEDGVTAKALIPDIRLPLGLWTFDLGYSRLLRFLKNTFELNDDLARGPCNLVTFPYDWRLSNRYNGAQLKSVAESALARWANQGSEYAESKLVFICHSMGGLVARWYVDCLGGAAHTRAVIGLGTPHRGAAKAVIQLSNGITRGPTAFREALTQLGRSMPSLYQLLPEYACIEHEGRLSKTTDVDIPELESHRVRDAMAFQLELADGRAKWKQSYALHPIGGFKQRTWTTARLTASGVEGRFEIQAQDERGDGTVPRLSFTPPDLSPASVASHYVADNHGGLVHNPAVFDQLEGILTANPVIHLAPRTHISVEVPEVLDAAEPLTVHATVHGSELPLEVIVASDAGAPIGPPVRLLERDGVLQATPPLPGPGVYQVTVRGVAPTGIQVSPITTVVLAWPTEAELGPLT